MPVTRMSILLLFVSLCLGACSTRTETGNFIVDYASTQQVGMAEDSLKQLVRQYPPAKTRFRLMQETRDIYGVTLLGGLRNAGYAVDESGSESVPAGGGDSLPLRYTVDRQNSLYRVVLHVGGQTLSRAWLSDNDVLQPASAWSFRE